MAAVERTSSRNLCLGEDLPDDLPRVVCPEEARSLIDWCDRVAIGESRLLYEAVGRGNERMLYYWMELAADVMPLRLCELDRFATKISQRDARWGGRRPDYVVVGWHGGEGFMVFVELRRELTQPRQMEDKIEQMEQGMRLLCKGDDASGVRFHADADAFVADVCEGMVDHKVVGVVIPALFSKSRARQRGQIEVGGRTVVVVPLPHYQMKDCTLTWSGLFRAIGL